MPVREKLTYHCTSGADGKWAYTGTIAKTVIATATDGASNTSPFSSLALQPDDYVLKQYTCAYKGSIKLNQTTSGLLFHWDKKEQNGNLAPISDNQNVSNLEPGTYQLTVQYPGGCQKVTQLFEIKDMRVKIQNIIMPPPPECRQKSFQFDVNYTGGTGNIVFTWKNAAGNVVSNEKAPQLPEGKYTLTISDDAGCAVTSSVVTIKAKPGPDYDVSTANITPARCGEKNGSITNVTTYVGIGTLSYKWYNANGDVVSTSKDLVNVVSGWYTLEVADQSECSPYKQQAILVPEVNSITITGGNVTPITCNNNNGSITGVQVSSNVDFVQWYDANNNPMPTTLSDYSNRYNLQPGSYRLYARHTVVIDGKSYVCEYERYFTVSVIPPETFNATTQATINTTCGLNNGAISVNFPNNNAPSAYQWLDGSDNVIGYTNQLSNLSVGSYKLILTDKNGCISTYGKFEVKATALLQFAANNNPVTTPDECDQSLGSVNGIVITGGVQPYTYKWTDENNQPVGSNSATLTNVPKGTYHLSVTDNTPCATPLLVDVTIDNNKFIPNAPALADKRICVPEKVVLNVANPISGNYNLYTSNTATTPLQTSNKGVFSIQVNETSDYYVSYNIGSLREPAYQSTC